jgi:hypothetical protein
MDAVCRNIKLSGTILLVFTMVSCGSESEQSQVSSDVLGDIASFGNKNNPIQIPSAQPFFVLDKKNKKFHTLSVDLSQASLFYKFIPSQSLSYLTGEIPSVETPETPWAWKNFYSNIRGIHASSLELNGVSVWGAEVKTVVSNSLANPSLTYLQGNLPAVSNTSNFKLNPETAAEKASWSLNYHPWRFKFIKKIYFPTANVLRASYLFHINSNPSELGRMPGFPLEVVVDAETADVISEKVLALHVDGIAKIYEENSRASRSEGLKDITLPDLDADGTELGNSMFKVLNCAQSRPSASCVQKAIPSKAGGDYSHITYLQDEMDEVVAFHALSKSSAWYRRIIQASPADGSSWGEGIPGVRSNLGFQGSYKANVYVRALTYNSKTGQSTPDNASYLPSGTYGEGTPHIVIGTGWEFGQGEERSLQNLGKDADVSMHEFGHHIVWRSLRETVGQSGHMHEGYADYFTYAITGNTLLGESIVKSKPSLRDGNQVGKVTPFLEKKFENLPHYPGQFWSSTLWEIRKSMGIWVDGFYKFDKIVWISLDLIKRNANYYNAIDATNKAIDVFAKANNDNASVLKEKFYNILFERGFLAHGWKNEDVLPAPSLELKNSTAEESLASVNTSTAEKKKSASKQWYECGVVSGKDKTNDSKKSASTGILVFVPLVFILLFEKLRRRKNFK